MASTSTKGSSSSSKIPHKYDVFLSFRGGDTRTNFVDHLYAGLVADGFNTFRDDEELERGGEISSQLLDAIKESHIFVVVFSQNYAHSRWCLDELLASIESIARDNRRIVLPIFYHVDPSDVRHQKGSYATRHTSVENANEEKVRKWRQALTKAANLSGYHVGPFTHEAKIIEEIATDISSRINREPLHVSTHLVGVDKRLNEIMKLMSIRSKDVPKDVLMVGICGLGGVGKSTMVKAIYNQLFYQFKRKSFLEEVGDHGLLDLQRQLYCDISPRGKRKISTLAEGITVLKKMLCHEKVLLVIDDVNNRQQLEKLAGGHDWFGEGSRIFITSRDKGLLVAHKVDELYELPPLSTAEALELFSWHAFNQGHPCDVPFYILSSSFVRYCQGLPLALKILGSFLSEMTFYEWKSELDRLDIEPNMDILDVLKVSLDAVQGSDRAIFLDIACFFNGEHKDFIIKILDGCGFPAESGIRFLKNKCLLTISDGKVGMHNLIQQLGHKVVRDENPVNIGSRSRLWHHMDVQDVLRNETGTNLIEGVFLNLWELNNITLTTRAMEGMKVLRLLKIFLGSELVSGEEDYKVNIFRDFKFPSGHLCYLYWHGYPLYSLPSKFKAPKLVELNMPYSNIREFGKGNMVQFSKLTAIILSHSKYLIKVSNFSSTPNLEKLILEGCTNLRKIDQSIGDLRRLGLLDLKECKSLVRLPDSICNVKSLKTLYLSGCSKLNRLPPDLGNMEHLTEFYANRTATGVPPPSIGGLRELQMLSFSGCTGGRSSKSWFTGGRSYKSWFHSRCIVGSYQPQLFEPDLSLLRELDLSDCYWWSVEILDDLWNLYSLEKLNLSGNDFKRVPESIAGLSRLKVLVLGRCKWLTEIFGLPRSLEQLDAHECETLDMKSQRPITFEPHPQPPMSEFCFLIPGDRIPERFKHQEMGSSLTMELPSDWYNGDFMGFCVCFVFAFKDQLPQIHDDISCQLNNFSFFYPYWDKWSGEDSSNKPHMWLAYQPRSGVDICHPEAWSSIRASFELSGVTDALPIKCAIQLIYADELFLLESLFC